MKSGKCPKCGSQEVHFGKGKSGQHGLGGIPLGGTFQPVIKRDFYICVDCDYVESYVSNHKDSIKLTKKWPRVDDIKRKNDEY